uniref:Uncharacterized protein n=1 Tax=Arundo donax TaxID=35708 RepID=A0A0A9FZQ6_ARUDO
MDALPTSLDGPFSCRVTPRTESQALLRRSMMQPNLKKQGEPLTFLH